MTTCPPMDLWPRMDPEEQDQCRRILGQFRLSTTKAAGAVFERIISLWAAATTELAASLPALLSIFAVGMAVLSGSQVRLLCSFIAALVIVPVLTEFPFARYREPAMPLLFFVAAIGIERMWRLIARHAPHPDARA